eukprot:scaffold171205_cov18-Tisochrysis_lutea.AAC.1
MKWAGGTGWVGRSMDKEFEGRKVDGTHCSSGAINLHPPPAWSPLLRPFRNTPSLPPVFRRPCTRHPRKQ